MLLLLCFSKNIKAQNIPEILELNVDFTSSQNTYIKRAQGFLESGEELLEESKNLYEQNKEDEASAIKTIHKAAAKYNTGVLFARDTYMDMINAFEDEVRGPYRNSLDRGQYYRDIGVDYFLKARSKRGTLDNIETFPELFYEVLEVFDFERLALLNMARTMRIYQDWPIEYDYEWDDFRRPDDPLLAEDRKRDSISAVQASVIASPDSTIIFKAQIAAHTIEIPLDYMKTRVYKGGREISVDHSDGWYRYDIGTFYSYDEAKHVVNNCNVDKAFVAAYQNGVRIDIIKAINATSRNLDY